MKSHFLTGLLACLSAPLFSPLVAAPRDDPAPPAAVTPAEWLRAQPKPKFRAGHTLPRLTRFAWDMDDGVRVALAEDWGYALEFGVADVERVDRAINDPTSREGKLLALAISDGGRPLSYNWLSAGWEGEKGHSHGDIARWTGFLKCYYTAGMIGGNAGYYQYLGRDGFSKPFAPGQPPHWLRQITALAHVHATFSHLEDFLRNGDLLPGPDKHRISKDSPAFEFPTGDKNVRVLARKHRQRAEWLVTAWVAEGDAREVTVTIPDLGEIKLQARPDGAVYLASLKDGQLSLTQIDF